MGKIHLLVDDLCSMWLSRRSICIIEEVMTSDHSTVPEAYCPKVVLAYLLKDFGPYDCSPVD